MSPADDSADDDRTVIRPPGAPAARSDKTLAAGAPPLNDRTLAVGAPPPSPAGQPDAGNGLPVGTYLGEFELTKMVAEGGFGIVYLATDHSLQRRVALKEYMPSSLASRTSGSNVQEKSERYRETFAAGLKSFINEARLLASFDHPSLLKVYRFWEANGTAYMVMPFYEGKTLKDRLRELDGPPDEAWLRTLLAPLTEALQVIHAEQCYHRDIAPDNVILLGGSHQRPLLLDFGAARRVIGDMTQALTVILKPGYAPVEQYAEIPGMKQGPWTDVYALAAVVHYAIMGKTPPPSVGRLLNDTYVPLVKAAAGRYSESFLAAIDRALAVRPETRTQSIPQLREELGLAATAAPVDVYTTRPLPPAVETRAPPPPPRDPLPPMSPPAAAGPAAPAPEPKSKAMLGIGIGVVALGAVAFGAYSLLTPSPRPAPAPVVADAPAPPADTAAVVAPPAPPPPAPPPPPATLEPFTEFARVVQAQNADFGVRLTAPSTQLSAQRADPIRFNIQAEREGFLYVFLAAEDGTLLMVIPSADQGLVSLKKGQTYRFPVVNGPAVTAAEPLGRDQVLAIVSARQRDFGAFNAKAWPDLPLTRLFPSGAEGGKVLAAHTGPQPALAGRAICPDTGACDSGYGAAVLTLDIVK